MAVVVASGVTYQGRVTTVTLAVCPFGFRYGRAARGVPGRENGLGAMDFVRRLHTVRA